MNNGGAENMIKMNLNEGWELTYEKLNWGPEMAPAIFAKNEGWMGCDVPCDIHIPLINSGIIKEPLEALNCYDCNWVEDKSWWFKKIFVVDHFLLDNDVVEMTLESLDAEADIFLNSFHLAHHKSAFYPFNADVKRFLMQGENVLLVRVTSGLEQVSELDITPIKQCITTEIEGNRVDRGDKRRAFIRKPQYVYGWDWGPRVATCGIMKDVYIKAYKKIAIRSVQVVTKSASNEFAQMDVKVEVENLHPFMSFDGKINLEIIFDEKVISVTGKTEHLRSGLNYISLFVELDNPKLWWPNGMGCQSLYTVKASVSAGNISNEYPEFKFGIRTLRLNMDRLNDQERLFTFEINGVKTFCKGGNWIPADSIYGRVSDEKYGALIGEARNANFNMLRVWGGGIYEKDIFYEKCDEYGILIWQDFMFACAMYPDNKEWFRMEAEREMDYQTRRLRNHSCMTLWSGSNENNWGFCDWWIGEKKADFYGGEFCYNNIAPAIVEKNCSNIPYWNGSPYGGDNPNGNEIGDRHHWNDCTMNADMNKRITPEEYDKITSKFISEYGYIGPCAKSTIEKYHGGNPVNRDGAIWKYHNNTFEKDTVVAGIAKHYIDNENMDMESYLLYAGLCQGLMYQYSLEAIRFKEDCWGSLFWMYNDCWGEVGWTIIDYYLKKKPSYYYVKRAFEPVKLILREEKGMVKVMGVNETQKPANFNMEYGYLSFDGRIRKTMVKKMELSAFSRKILFEFYKGDYDFINGLCFVKPESSEITPAILRIHDYRKLNVKKAKIKIGDIENKKDTVSFTVSSENFAHAVHFGLNDEIHISDEYFDLLPGEIRRIEMQNLPENFKIEDLEPLSIVVK
jgi:beta-mannosidase